MFDTAQVEPIDRRGGGGSAVGWVGSLVGLGVDQASTTGPRTDAVVVITVDDEDVAERVRALDGEPLPAQVAGLLTCDASLQALLVGRTGQPLWMGRSSRLATGAQRRALANPGCTMPAEWCDVHHQPGWRRGGHTDMDRMVTLCRCHHGAVHGNRRVLRPAGGPVSTTGPPGQRFEWHDRHAERRLPARQRGMRRAA